MSKYMWRGALIGFLVTLVLGGILFAFGPESVRWAFKPLSSEVSVTKGVLIPTIITAFMGAIVGASLEKFWLAGKDSLVKGFVFGMISFFLAALASTFTVPFFGAAIIDLVHLPGTILKNLFVYPFLKFLVGADFTIAEAREPLIAWTYIATSLFTWGFIGSLVSYFRSRK